METSEHRPAAHRSRRSVLGGLLGALAVAASGARCAAHPVSQEEAAYQDTPRGGQRCADCRHFIAPNACSRVEGEISPQGWCRFWEAR